MLKLWAKMGLICLKYLDESGFCCQSNISYSYIKIGEQKKINQKKRRGRRVSILGLYEVGKSFSYGLIVGGVKAKSYLEIMEWQVKEAEKRWLESGIKTVIVLDNYSLHKSKKVKEKISEWSQKGLEFFYLPPYSSEMNLIETEWHQIKIHELAGRIFEDEYDLSLAVQQAIINRSEKNNLVCQRYKFNSS